MFTGIIQGQGFVTQEQSKDDKKTLWIHAPNVDKTHFTKGASIACNGVCLTVEHYTEKTQVFQVTLVKESLERTTFKMPQLHQYINLEPALRIGDALGGHFVTGHADGLAKIIRWDDQLVVELPESMKKFIAPQGSLCLHGVSLTIQNIKGLELFFSIIPETKLQTNLANYQIGDFLNFEVDYFARSLYPYLDLYLKK